MIQELAAVTIAELHRRVSLHLRQLQHLNLHVRLLLRLTQAGQCGALSRVHNARDRGPRPVIATAHQQHLRILLTVHHSRRTGQPQVIRTDPLTQLTDIGRSRHNINLSKAPAVLPRNRC